MTIGILFAMPRLAGSSAVAKRLQNGRFVIRRAGGTAISAGHDQRLEARKLSEDEADDRRKSKFAIEIYFVTALKTIKRNWLFTIGNRLKSAI